MTPTKFVVVTIIGVVIGALTVGAFKEGGLDLEKIGGGWLRYALSALHARTSTADEAQKAQADYDKCQAEGQAKVAKLQREYNVSDTVWRECTAHVPGYVDPDKAWWYCETEKVARMQKKTYLDMAKNFICATASIKK